MKTHVNILTIILLLMPNVAVDARELTLKQQKVVATYDSTYSPKEYMVGCASTVRDTTVRFPAARGFIRHGNHSNTRQHCWRVMRWETSIEPFRSPPEVILAVGVELLQSQVPESTVRPTVSEDNTRNVSAQWTIPGSAPLAVETKSR